MKTLSLCMIAKDEEKHIENCLNSVRPIVDEIIVVDTGSTDNTVEIAKEFNAKIFEYEWNDNFSNARNFALSKASSDWILMLDADEAVHYEDAAKLKEMIQDTEADAFVVIFYNFIGSSLNGNFVTHTGLRLFKNHMFYYNGIIHEQLNRTNSNEKIDFKESGIRIMHYGYLKPNAVQKDKRGRNIPLIQKVLDETPENGFHLFNMGNEYMCMEDYEKAVYYFNKSIEQKEYRQAYFPHLLYRKASCLHYLKRNVESLRALSHGLVYYPQCTDYEFLKGSIYKVTKRYTLAIDSFNKCLEMGEPVYSLSFIPDAGTLKPLLSLGEIYFTLEDWEKSLKHYVKAININSKRHDIIYKIGQVLNKMYADKAKVCQMLEGLFCDGYHLGNVILIVDILLNESIYDRAPEYFSRIENSAELPFDIAYLKGRILFYQHEYDSAYAEFMRIVSRAPEHSLIVNMWSKALVYAIICCMASDINFHGVNAIIESLSENDDKRVLLYFTKKEIQEFGASSGKKILNVLSEILKLSEFDLFEQSLPALNLIDSSEVLLDLAEIYYQNGHKEMAVKTILRSVKELGVINSRAVYILNKEFDI